MNNPQTALITGITGQDGSYLCELLLSKGYVVHGLTRSSESPKAQKLKRLLADQNLGVDLSRHLRIHAINLEDAANVRDCVHTLQAGEIYHLASQSHIGASYQAPVETFAANTLSVLHLLEAIRSAANPQKFKFFVAGSAAIFEGAEDSPQTEQTPLSPRSPYGTSKASAKLLVETFRASYGLFACTGILFNHESPRRPAEFVTAKIVNAVARIALKQQQSLELGNIETGRDWGFAGDYVRAMWQMLQNDVPEDFIIATGKWHTLTDLLKIAFRTVRLDWQAHTHCDPQLVRPHEPVRLLGDSSAIRSKLGWEPLLDFESMIQFMVEQKLAMLKSALKLLDCPD